MEYMFLEDLDNYFCEHFNDYFVISNLDGYGFNPSDCLRRVYTNPDVKYPFSLEEEKFKLCFQQNKFELLKQLKNKLQDNSNMFSYRYIPLGIRIKLLFSKKDTFSKIFEKMISKYGSDIEYLVTHTNLDRKLFNLALKNRILFNKRVLIKICLLLGMNFTDHLILMNLCKYSYNNSVAFDVISRFLFEKKIFNRDMINLALKEYKLEKMF